MVKRSRLVFATVVVGMAMLPSAATHGQNGDASQPGASAAMPPSVLRLDSLGFREGLVFDGFAGEQTLFLRVPAGVSSAGARLVLPYRAFATAPVRRIMTVTAGPRLLGQFPLAAAGTLDVPIPADAIEGGSIAITLRYDGGASPNRCYDARMTGDRLVFDPRGGLALAVAPGAPLSVAAALATLPPRPTIVMSARPDERQAAAALSIVAARGGGVIATRPAVNGNILIAPADAPALVAGGAGAPIALTIGGPDPARAVRTAFGDDAGLLAASRIDRVTLGRRAAPALTFAALGADTSMRAIPADGGWSFAVPASRLPAGKEIAGVALDLAAGPSAPGDRVTVALNGQMLGGAQLPGNGRARFRFPVAGGSTHSLNGVSVSIARARGDDCGSRPRTWPAQLLPTSEMLVRDAGPIDDFSDFAARTRDGVSVVLAGPRDLPLAAKAVAGLVGSGVPIRVSYGAIPTDGPAIIVSATPPAGMEPKLLARGGRLTLAADAALELDLPDGSDTVAQLGEADGRPLLWIKPGAVEPASLWLDQGDVALVAANGVVNPLFTTRPHPSTAPADKPGPWKGLGWGWLAVAGLILGIAIAAWSFMPSVRKPKPGQSAE